MKKKISHEKKRFHMKKKIYFVILLFDADLFEIRIIEYRIKRISF